MCELLGLNFNQPIRASLSFRGFRLRGRSLWPTTIKQVKSSTYTVIQETVRKFIAQKHNNGITPVQFDDIYWEALNRDKG